MEKRSLSDPMEGPWQWGGPEVDAWVCSCGVMPFTLPLP